MEIAIPLIALGSLYFLSTKKHEEENFTQRLPNTDIPNKNYPSENVEDSNKDVTSSLSKNNEYNGGTFTDKFFDQKMHSTAETSENIFQTMTGQQVDRSHFQHNNMVPFFGSKQRTRHDSNDRNESILDNYNGSGSQYIKKVEQSPLFSPQTNLQYINGTPNQSDFIQSRMNVSMKMSNVKPFADEKVAPGIGLGYGTEGMGGYNSGMLSRELWQEKTVDELRVANKPKAGGLIALGYEGPANSYVKKIGENNRIGRFEKNLPDTYFDITPERYFTTVGVEKGHALIPIPIVKDVSRPETSTEYTGGAGIINVQKEYVPGEYRPSNNQQLGPVPLAIADRTGLGPATNNDYSIQGVKIYNNNRTVTDRRNANGYFGSAGNGIISETIAPFLDLMRPSRKENTVESMRPYQNVKTVVGNSYVYNPYDRPLPTIKETTVNSKFHLNVNVNQRGAYESTPYQSVEQNRDTTNVYYAGGSEAPSFSLNPRSREAENNQRNNELKEASMGREYTPSGNIDTFNATINQRNNVENEVLTLNSRDLVPALPINPEYFTGSLNDRENKTYDYNSQIQLERNNGDVLKQLKENPYVLPINGKNSII
jgi:hypothetical protein